MNRPIRILLQADYLTLGGLERKVAQLALRLDRKRFETTVAYTEEWGAHGEELQRAGIPVVEIVPKGRSRRGVSQAIRQIRELAPDIYHTFSCRQNANDVIVARRAGVPLVISSRDNVRHWAPEGPAQQWEFERNSLTDFVTPCCEASAYLSRKLEGVPAERMVMIHNGVDLPLPSGGPSIREELALPAGTLLAGYAARYRGLKAHDNLLRALRKVVDQHPAIHVVCCGLDGDGRVGELRELVSRLSLEQHVTLQGPRLDMDAFYRGLDLYVHPSNAEALSLAILEAMSYGLPVVATSVGGTPEAVAAGETGLLVPPGDSRALAEAMLRLMDQPEARERMGAAGRQRVGEHFSLNRMIAAYEDLYERAMAKSAPRISRPAEPQFTGSPDAPLLADTTVFVTTIGDEANFADCMDHLRAQSVRCRMELIDRVAPMSAAFARMHELCGTPFYVQVDEDMILHREAIEKLHDLIVESPPDVAMVCAPLWDCDVERPIFGVKIYRYDIVKKFPYQDTFSCEVKQLEQVLAAGYKTHLLPTDSQDAVCLGEHGKHYTPETIFRRWQRIFLKHHRLGNMTWLEPWPSRLMERYITTRDPVHLYAMLGAIAGIAGRVDAKRELDWRDIDPALQRMRYYFRVPGSES